MSCMSFSCYVCSKNLTIETADEIVSIQCGHVFHATCLKRRHKEQMFSIFKTPKCPQCLAEIKTTLKLNLNLCETDKDHQINELKSEINHHYEINRQLHHDLETKTQEFQKTEGQYNKNCEEKSRLNRKVKELTTQIDNLKKQFDQKEAQIKEILHKNEKLSEEVASKTLLIHQLKRKNELMALELATKIQHSTKLVVEKSQLQSVTEYSTPHSQQNFKKTYEASETRKSQAAQKQPYYVLNEQNLNTTVLKKGHQSKIESHQIEEVVTIAATKLETNLKKFPTPNGQENKDASESITIKCIGQTASDEVAAENYVHQLSKMMGFALNKNDITKISCSIKDNDTFVFVTFKSTAIKSNFLSKKRQFARDNFKKLKNVYIYDFVSDKTLELFEKAKSLKRFGFKHVYFENDLVYVKRNQNSFPITISDLSHIESIKNGFEVLSALKS